MRKFQFCSRVFAVMYENMCIPTAVILKQTSTYSCKCLASKGFQQEGHKVTLLLLLSPQSCPTLCDPIDGSPPGSRSLGVSRQEHWSGLPFPSPMHESEKWKWSHSVVSDSLWPHRLQPTRLLCPRDFPGKSTGVGCHCLLRRWH